LLEPDLISRARQWESHAWTEIYEEFYDRIYRFIFFKTGSREEAQNLSSRIFLKALGPWGPSSGREYHSQHGSSA
jgi:DNA-directed RNA polymerase specialized sigma24 family protein